MNVFQMYMDFHTIIPADFGGVWNTAPANDSSELSLYNCTEHQLHVNFKHTKKPAVNP
jgi:hypothetical protein